MSNPKKQMQLLRKGGNTISATRLPTLLFPLLHPLLMAHSMPRGAASESRGGRHGTGQVCVV